MDEQEEHHTRRQRVRQRPSGRGESPAPERTDQSERPDDVRDRLERGTVRWFTPPLRRRREFR